MAGDEPSPDDATESPVVGGSTVLTLDTVLELLASRRRRYAIYALLDAPRGVVAFDDLVDAVARLEGEAPAGQTSDDGHQAIATDLHYWHLPVLEEVQVVSYDDRSDVVQFDGNRALVRWAERVRDEEFTDAG